MTIKSTPVVEGLTLWKWADLGSAPSSPDLGVFESVAVLCGWCPHLYKSEERRLPRGGGAVVKFRSEKVEGELLVGSVGAEPELFLGWMWRFWVCTHRSVVLCGAQYSGSTGSYGCFLVFLLVFVVFFPDYKINTYLVEKAWKLNMDVQKKKEITHKSNKT